MSNTPLAFQHCQPRHGPGHALSTAQIDELLEQLPGWTKDASGKAIVKSFRFDNFHQTLEFINAVGFIANRNDHHPDIEASYGRCQLMWSTHDVGGLSLNDFISAARVEALLKP